MVNETKALTLLREALAAMREQKPNDRSDTDRAYAVAITEMEKLFAYFVVFVEPG